MIKLASHTKLIIQYDGFSMAPYAELLNSLITFDDGLETKNALFDERSEEFAFLGSELSIRKSY